MKKYYDDLIQMVSEYHSANIDYMVKDGDLDKAVEDFINTLTDLRGE